ncbi:MAG TPA: hypothetical protein VFH98_04585 [Candidatus Limnocylindria bacterium]|jgi:hypothetical protein|nr:hypothetical protein [Candidatus Limnocylindria bacterium]
MWDVLRVIVGALGAVMVAVALLLFSAGGEAAWSGAYPLVLGLVAIATALFERSRYWPGRGRAADAGLRPTNERFIDPTTGERTQVWIDSATGERTYLPDGEQPQK